MCKRQPTLSLCVCVCVCVLSVQGCQWCCCCLLSISIFVLHSNRASTQNKASKHGKCLMMRVLCACVCVCVSVCLRFHLNFSPLTRLRCQASAPCAESKCWTQRTSSKQTNQRLFIAAPLLFTPSFFSLSLSLLLGLFSFPTACLLLQSTQLK